MTRPRKWLLGVGLLVLIQAALLLGYRWLEMRRAGAGFGVAMERRSEIAPDFVVERADGSQERVGARSGRFQLVHFWATWCPPCREELPLLQRRSRREPERLLVWMVSADPGWDAVKRYFGGDVPAPVVRDPDRRASRAYRVTDLPDTYLVDPSGRVVARFPGPQHWTSSEMDAALEGLLGQSR